MLPMNVFTKLTDIEIDSQTWKTNLRLPKGKGRGRGKLGNGD